MNRQTTGWQRAAVAVAVVTALGVAGCSKNAPPAAATAPATAPTAAPAAAAPAAVTTDAELLAKAKAAESEKRYYAPAGDNAIEYYLALRQRNPKDPLVNNALQDLFPYAMIATEQSLKKGDEPGRVEAARIFALLERVNADAPSLPRLRTMMQTEAAAELKQQQDEAQKAQAALAKKTEEDKAKAAAAAAAKPATAAPEISAAPRPVKPAPAAAPPPVAATPPPAPVEAAPAPKPARAATPTPITAPQPVYPRDALRDGVSGEVTVAFTINADGSVSGAKVASSNPRRVFDAAALEAIRKWKFEAPGQPVPMQRTFAFNPGN